MRCVASTTVISRWLRCNLAATPPPARARDDVIDHFLDQDAVVALAHHADHRLGAGGADQQAAVAVEPFLAVDDRGLHLGVVERLAAAVAHVLQDLRQRIEAVADFRDRAAEFLHHSKHLQRSDEAVAGGGVVGQDDVTGRLAAEIVAAARASARARSGRRPACAPYEGPSPCRKRSSPRFDITVATMPGWARRPSSFQLCAITASNWSPSTTWPRSSTRMTRSASPSSAMPISARISRTLLAQRLRRGRAAFLVDVDTIRLDADGDDVGAQFPQRFRHHLVAGAVGAIDHDAQAIEAEVARQRALGEFDVAVMDAVDAAGAAETWRLVPGGARSARRAAARSASRRRRTA